MVIHYALMPYFSFHIKISFGDHSKFTLIYQKLPSQHFSRVTTL
jgi:hypothetical protein